ncbi:MAG: radical SAM protein [Candidatus Gastranaerophilales bacterium]|nr:radical SAM protein [Candidatus Gastranaerophilales bacterium]
MDCHLLSHGISVEKDSLHDCCLTHGYNGRPFIIKLNKDNTVDWADVFDLKKILKDGKRINEKECKGCRLLGNERIFTDEGDYISHINLNHWNICNSKCVYCSKDYNGGDKYFNVLPMMKELFAYNGGKAINTEGELTFQGGEPTMLPEFEELINMFTEKKILVRIHSSGIKYSQAVTDGLKNNSVILVVSPDTAVKETYKKIKRVDACDRVWQNLEKYAEAQKEPDRVKAKFIIIAGYNDSIEEIDAFLQRAKSIGINRIVWEIECMYAARYQYDIPHVSMLLDYAVRETEKCGLTYEYYDGAMYVQNKKNNVIRDITDKAAFSEEFETLKERYKDRNLDYIKIFSQ